MGSHMSVSVTPFGSTPLDLDIHDQQIHSTSKIKDLGENNIFSFRLQNLLRRIQVLKPSDVNTNSDLDRFLISIVFSVSDSTLRTDSDFGRFLSLLRVVTVSSGTLRIGSDLDRFLGK